jgi:hypothetical protein
MDTRNLTGTSMNFYPWVRVQISIRNLFTDERIINLFDPLPYIQPAKVKESPWGRTRNLHAQYRCTQPVARWNLAYLLHPILIGILNNVLNTLYFVTGGSTGQGAVYT